jgi:hypothetical protein
MAEEEGLGPLLFGCTQKGLPAVPKMQLAMGCEDGLAACLDAAD